MMAPNEAELLEWLFLILGGTLVFSGWRTIRRRRTRTQYGEHVGKGAVRLGWFWLILGLLIILAALTNVPILKAFGRLFMESDA